MARRVRGLEAQAQVTRDRLEAIGAVAARFRDWRPQAEVIRNVEAVQTVFPHYDDVTGVGGHPISRFALLHGPSNEGKTEFALGLMLSFLRAGHFAGLADAERTTTARWVRTLMRDAADHPGFSALPIQTYEHVRSAVRDYCETIATARAKGELPEDTTGIVVVDSIRKLVPKKLWEALAKAEAADEAEDKQKPRAKQRGRFGKKKDSGIDGYGGRAAQFKAALNAAWVDELIPLLADTRMAMVVIARETNDDDAGQWSGKDWKVGGGKALFYEASLDVRITRDWLRATDGTVIGERHRLEIWKTKVAGKQVSVPVAYVHTSNGVQPGIPAGFDLARDLVTLGLELGVLTQSGSWLSIGDQRLGQGFDRTVFNLTNDEGMLPHVEAAVRAASRKRNGLDP